MNTDWGEAAFLIIMWLIVAILSLCVASMDQESINRVIDLFR